MRVSCHTIQRPIDQNCNVSPGDGGAGGRFNWEQSQFDRLITSGGVAPLAGRAVQIPEHDGAGRRRGHRVTWAKLLVAIAGHQLFLGTVTGIGHSPLRNIGEGTDGAVIGGIPAHIPGIIGEPGQDYSQLRPGQAGTEIQIAVLVTGQDTVFFQPGRRRFLLGLNSQGGDSQ